MITITLQAPLEAADGVAHRPKKPPRAERKKGNVIPDGTRTHNLRLRKPTPYPFGHWDFGTSSGTRTHNLTLRRGAPYPLGHGGIKKSCCAHRTALFRIPDFQKQKTYAWSGVRTHADKRPADLKSAPLDPSGIQARNTRRPQVNEPKARAGPYDSR